MLSPIPSGSMENTIQIGDFAVGSRLNTKDIQRYDIVTFDSPDNPKITYIKRVIGLPGETVIVQNGEVWVDGEKLDDSFVKESMNDSGDGTYVVPEGCYFMMGDNRHNSLDSRYWGFVPEDHIVGRPAMVWLSTDAGRKFPNNIRWRRFFKFV